MIGKRARINETMLTLAAKALARTSTGRFRPEADCHLP